MLEMSFYVCCLYYIKSVCHILQYACMDQTTTRSDLSRMALNVGEQATSVLVREVRRRRAAEQRAEFLQHNLSKCQEELRKANLELDCLKATQLLLLDGINIFLCVFGVINVSYAILLL